MNKSLNIEAIQQWPWRGKFRIKTEIDNYFAGKKVQCLLCGKLFKALPQHLERTHDITAANYRKQYEF
jgi:predicted transcriptional regulator